MTIETQISLNMTSNQAPVVVDVVQGEQMTRVVSAVLYNGAQPWNIPGDVKAGVAFRKPDGTGGLYDELPNRSPAVTVSGSTVKATLAPQVQSVAGDVAAAIVFMVPSTMERLATFPFVLRVAKDPSTGSPASNDYYQYSTLDAVNKAITDVQASANAATEAVKGLQQAVAPAIPVTTTGTVVSTDMVSPVEHQVECKISGVPDLSAVTVSRYGKNLLDVVDFYKNTYNYAPDIVVDGRHCVQTSSGKGTKYPLSLPDGVYTISFDAKSVKGTPNASADYVFDFRYTDGTNDTVSVPASNEWNHYSLTSNSNKKIENMGVNAREYRNEVFIDKATFMLELSPKETEFSRYIPPEKHAPNSEGIVSGMASVSPSMTILTDNPSATITATYNADTKKYIDSKFAELQAAIISTGGNV